MITDNLIKAPEKHENKFNIKQKRKTKAKQMTHQRAF